MPRLAYAIHDQQRISNLKCVASLFPKARRARKIKKRSLDFDLFSRVGVGWFVIGMIGLVMRSVFII